MSMDMKYTVLKSGTGWDRRGIFCPIPPTWDHAAWRRQAQPKVNVCVWLGRSRKKAGDEKIRTITEEAELMAGGVATSARFRTQELVEAPNLARPTLQLSINSMRECFIVTSTLCCSFCLLMFSFPGLYSS